MLNKVENEPQEGYLSSKVFAGENAITITPHPTDVAGFAAFMARYKAGLAIEKTAVETLKGGPQR